MIFVWGLPGDGQIAAVTSALTRRNAPFFFFNQHDVLAAQIDLEVGAELSGTLSVGEKKLDIGAITAAYLRPYESVRVPSVQRAGTGSAGHEHARVLDDVLLSWCELTEAFVVNRPSDMASNGSKPYQAALIEAAGFLTPETLITTSAEEVRAFEAKHGAIVYKSISGVRSIVSRFSSKKNPERLQRLATCPTQFQRQVAGDDYRVHVVGERVFASHITSTVDDYRYATKQKGETQMKSVELPDDIAERCVRTAHSMRLWVAGVDLRRTPEGEWYCFEVNPSPGFTYFQGLCGFAMDDAIAALLASKGPGGAMP